MKRKVTRTGAAFGAVLTTCFLLIGALVSIAQEAPAPPPEPTPPAAPVPPPVPEPVAPEDPAAGPEVTAEDASVTAELNDQGGRIVVEATGVRTKVPVFFSAEARETVQVKPDGVSYQIGLSLKVIQGKAHLLSLGIGGAGELQNVSGEGLKAWSVRRVGEERFLDLQVDPKEERKEFKFVVQARIAKQELPASPDLLHLKAGKAVGFVSTVDVNIPAEISSRLVAADGFLPLESADDRLRRYEGSVGKRLAFAFSRSSAVSAPVELVNAWLEGTVDEKGGHTSFLFRATAEVTKDDAVIDILRGQAAASEVPAGKGYQLELVADRAQRPLYRLRFAKAGSYPVELKVVARLTKVGEWRNLNFDIPAGAIVPIVLRGIVGENEFREDAAVIPSKEGEAWRGFLPLDGRCDVAWKPTRKTGEGKLFFTTSAKVNLGVGAGALRQTTIVEYKILQGQLGALKLTLEGPGDVHDVDGPNILGWSETEVAGVRQLDVRLSRPLKDAGLLRVRSQLSLDAFPVRAKPLRLVPAGSIRHSGYIRIYNIGATRLEMAGVTGLTQLSPDQFPEKNLAGGDRQVFVYRFPAAAHDYEIAADRVQPEVTVAQNVIYELSQSERIINADVELDIREAPLREWLVRIPADYTSVSVSGAEVRDYVRGSEVTDNERTLNILFTKEVAGRQLVKINLQKKQAAESGQWVLPQLRHDKAKSVRGEMGLVGVPGFRMVVESSEKLTEIPISRFQKNRPDLRVQQAFRIREREWSATVNIESLPQSVQADVFHLYSMRDETAYVSVILNYFITGAPVSEFRLKIPEQLVKEDEKGGFTAVGNLTVSCNDLRHDKVVEDNQYVLTLQKGVIGLVTVLVTFELPLVAEDGSKAKINVGEVAPLNVASESGYLQVVNPVQANSQIGEVSSKLLKLNPTELPAEYQLVSSAPPIATYQYSGADRPFDFPIEVDWYEAGDTIEQVVEFMKATTEVSRIGGVVTKVEMRVKTRGRRMLKTELPSKAELWEVRVNNKPETARTEVSTDASGHEKIFHLIPLPADVDINSPVTVELDYGKPAEKGGSKYPVVTLPAVHAPISMAEWTVVGEKGRVLIPRRTKLPLKTAVKTESGLEWIAKQALPATTILFLLLAVGLWVRCGPSKNLWVSCGGLGSLLVALILSLVLVGNSKSEQRPHLETLEFSLPILAKAEPPTMVVANVTSWGAQVNNLGLVVLLAGIALLVWSFIAAQRGALYRIGGGALLSVGLLMQGGGAQLFYLLVAIVIALLLLPWLFRWWRQFQNECADWERIRREEAEARKEALEASKAAESEGEEGSDKGGDSNGPLPGAATTLLAIGLLLSLGGMSDATAQEKGKDKSKAPAMMIPTGLRAADAVKQSWEITEGRLKATGTVTVTGKPGDTFLLLKAPGVLTEFTGERLRVSKRNAPGSAASYVVSIRGPADGGQEAAVLSATFAYEMQVGEDVDRFSLATGPGAVQQVTIKFDETGWEFDSTSAMRVVNVAGQDGGSSAELLLAPLASAEIVRRPIARDVKSEKTQFYTEVSNLFLPSPGVIDGVHRIAVRPSQGEVSDISLTLPPGFTATDVMSGPVGKWQFDAETRVLNVVIEPAQASPFSLVVTTQSGLDPLPADSSLAPVAVTGSAGEVGLVALAFGSEAQPEKAEPDGMSAVNLTDFDSRLIPDRQGGKPVLHRVLRYGQAGATLALRVAKVEPELRVASIQVLSIGDERVTLKNDFDADISRAGLFQMSFPLPAGLEVDSLTGPALRLWTEFTEDNVRYIIMHLNGKTLGKHQFHLVLSGAPPAAGVTDWEVPRISLREAQRQTGTMLIKPTIGVRLEATTERNVSDVDPKEIGGASESALGFRLFQSDWGLQLGVTKDQPRIKADVLHTLTLREGQTQTLVQAHIKVDRASIRSLRVQLPAMTAKESDSLRSVGGSVNDMVPVVDDAGDPIPGAYELQFKHRVLGRVDFGIRWERTGGRDNDIENVAMVNFPNAERNSDYNVAVRAGRAKSGLDPKPVSLPAGWKKDEWNTVDKVLRQRGDQSAPALVFKCKPASPALELLVQRHSAADALNLRVVEGTVTTVVSPVAEPIGKHLTAVDLVLEVIQRNVLNVRLPVGGELLNVLVNGESVSLVHVGDAYQFFILPGPHVDRKAKVHFSYSTPGQKLGKLKLESPRLNVPLANIEWKVIVPKDYDLVKSGGDLDYLNVTTGEDYTLERYVAKNEEERKEQQKYGDTFMAKGFDRLNAGEHIQARAFFNSAANNNALDAASNEDARVQLSAVQRRQVEVALNTRRHRLLLDNQADDQAGFEGNAQLERAANLNPLVSHNDLRFNQEQYSSIVQGNTDADEKNIGAIAGQVVIHQRSTVPAPQTLRVAIPDEGKIYTFSRSVQVAKDAPLSLELKFEAPQVRSTSGEALVLVLVLGICVALVFGWRQKVGQ